MPAADPATIPPYRRVQIATMRPDLPVLSQDPREQTGTMRATQRPAPPYPREQTGTMRATQRPAPPYPREQTGARRASVPAPAQEAREQTATVRALPRPAPPYPRQQAGMRASPSAPSQDAREPAGAMRAAESIDAMRASQGLAGPPQARDEISVLRAAQGTGHPPHAREQTGAMRAAGTGEQIGVMRIAQAASNPGYAREQTGVPRAAQGSGAPYPREQTGVLRAARPPTLPGATGFRTKSGSLAPVPDQLRNRLQYVVLTAELTGGGIDARREDGLSRLVLWRDVVGVVARRMPPAYGSAAFVDIVSTAGSTLRIVPWTRITGDLVDGEPDDRPRAVVEHVLARCPAARLDPATRMFLDTGEPVQLPDLETLRAHDDRLA